MEKHFRSYQEIAPDSQAAEAAAAHQNSEYQSHRSSHNIVQTIRKAKCNVTCPITGGKSRRAITRTR